MTIDELNEKLNFYGVRAEYKLMDVDKKHWVTVYPGGDKPVINIYEDTKDQACRAALKAIETQK